MAHHTPVVGYGTLDDSPTPQARERTMSAPLGARAAAAWTPVPERRSRAFTDTAHARDGARRLGGEDFVDVLMRFGGGEVEYEDEDMEGEGFDGHHKLTSDYQAFCMMIKAIVGSGLLFLPRAFADGGIVVSAVAQCLIAMLTGLCIVIVVDARGPDRLSYVEMGEAAAGRWGRATVQAALLTFQLGLVTSYYIFVADTVVYLLRDLTGCAVDPSPATMIVLHLLLQVPVACIRNIRSLSIIAEVADFAIVGGILSLLFFCVRHIATNGTQPVASFRPHTFPLFVGTSVVSFEGVALMIPIKDSMRNQENFKPVLWKAVGLVCVLYTSVGVLGVLAFGESVEENLLVSIGAHGTLAHVVSFLYSVAIICSLPLQAFPAYRVIEHALGMPSGKNRPLVKWGKNAMRAVVLGLLAFAAIEARRNLHYIVAVIGGVAGVPLGFVLPAYIHDRVLGQNLLRDRLIFYFGYAMTVLVTTVAVVSWVKGDDQSVELPCVPPG